jgi:UDP-N-acetylmuramoyl-L-alanyl-D-glutamate--2,6-diaminopimelate ligase
VNLPLTGRFNVANALVAAGCAHLLGIDLASTIRGLEAVAPVPGRFQMIAGTEPLTVVVDYAHTPEGIAATVATARELALRHVIAVVGAGGDRDRSKRPLMGAAAASADLVVATSDNPRSEDPERILDQVLAGVGATAHIREPDRRKAIRMALTAAAAGDVVLILGKGHEQGQEIGGQVLPFDDRLVAVEELASLRSGAGAA